MSDFFRVFGFGYICRGNQHRTGGWPRLYQLHVKMVRSISVSSVLVSSLLEPNRTKAN